MSHTVHLVLGALALASCSSSIASGLPTDDEPHREAGAQALLVSSRPTIETFLASLENDQAQLMQAVTTEKFQVVRFPEAKGLLTIQQLRQMIGHCKRNENFQSNSVAVTVFYACQDQPSPRLVFNFENGRISRVLAGFLEPLRIVPQATQATDH